jgi:hypothetical protein
MYAPSANLGALVSIDAMARPVPGAPRSGPLAVLWRAGVIAFFLLAAFFTIRGRLESRRPSGSRTDAKGSEPTQLTVFAAFLIVLALVSLVLVSTHVIPGN